MELLCGDAPENPRWKKYVEKARRTNAQRDADEQRQGLASPSASPFLELRTGLEAISAGLATGDWEAIAEGFVMLQHVESVLRIPLLAHHQALYGKRG